MYAQQRLLRAKNQIDIFQGAPCDKCGKISMTLDDELINYSRGDSQVIKDYYKNLNFMTVRVFLDNKFISQVNFLDNKTKI